jgi:hypothetical protein
MAMDLASPRHKPRSLQPSHAALKEDRPSRCLGLAFRRSRQATPMTLVTAILLRVALIRLVFNHHQTSPQGALPRPAQRTADRASSEQPTRQIRHQLQLALSP